MKSSKIKIDRFIYNELKRIVELKPENTHKHLKELLFDLSPFSQRTGQQNRALHKFFSMLAEALILAGLEMKVVLKAETKLWWTLEAVKEYLWRPVQKSLYQKESTTELEKQIEIETIHENLMRLLGEKYGVEYIPFPQEKKKVEKEEIDYPESSGPTAFD